MEAVTILVALAGIVLIMMISNHGLCLGVFLCSLVLYPEYLRIPLGVAQMSAPRLIAIALIIKILMDKRFLFQWKAVDYLVIAFWVWRILANLILGADVKTISFIVGSFFDTVMIYFVARLSIKHYQEYKLLVYPVVMCVVVLGFLAFMESINGWSPYHALFKYHKWMWMDKANEYRMGLMRARGSASHYITFGVSMVWLFGVLLSIRYYIKNVGLKLFFYTFAILGVFSSLSSGPYVSIAMVFFFNSFFYFKQLIKPTIIIALIGMVVIELFSNRHIYFLVDYLALNSSTSWYRGKLIEVAIGQLHEYWLFGFGGDHPHHWGPLIDGRKHVDVVNHYIIVAIESGLPGLMMYLSILTLSIKEAVFKYKNFGDEGKKLIFSLCSLLLGVMVGCLAVSLFGLPVMMLFCLLGLLSSDWETDSDDGSEERVQQHEEVGYNVFY